jgi:transcription antitermination factor NusG
MGANAVPASFRFRVGDRARINRGRFEGYEVEVVAVDDPGRTVRVAMSVFNRPVSLTFSFSDAVGLMELLPSGQAEPS